MEYLFPLSGNFSVQSQCDREDRLIFVVVVVIILFFLCVCVCAKFQHGTDESTGVQL